MQKHALVSRLRNFLYYFIAETFKTIIHWASDLMLTTQRNGFTLIELMITVVIVAILAAVAYPSYTQYVVRTNRSAAQSFMFGLASEQEQHLLTVKSYFCSTAGACGFVKTLTVPAEVSKNYTIIVAAPNGPPAYVITAQPIGAQQSSDLGCGSLLLDQTGKKDTSVVGAAPKCW